MAKLCGDDFVRKESHDPQEFNQGPNARLNPNNMINLEKQSQSVGPTQPQHHVMINLSNFPIHKTPIKGNRPPTSVVKEQLLRTQELKGKDHESLHPSLRSQTKTTKSL